MHHHTPSHSITHHHTTSHTITLHHTPSHTITLHHTPSHNITHHHNPGEMKPHSHSCKNLQTCSNRFNYHDLIICIFNCHNITSFDSTNILTHIHCMCTVKYANYNILTLNTKAGVTTNRNRRTTEGTDMSGFRSNGGKQESGTKVLKEKLQFKIFDRVTAKITENSIRIKI